MRNTHTHTLHFVEFIETFTHNKVSFVVIISAIMTTHEAGAPAAMHVQPEFLRALTVQTLFSGPAQIFKGYGPEGPPYLQRLIEKNIH